MEGKRVCLRWLRWVFSSVIITALNMFSSPLFTCGYEALFERKAMIKRREGREISWRRKQRWFIEHSIHRVNLKYVGLRCALIQIVQLCWSQVAGAEQQLAAFEWSSSSCCGRSGNHCFRSTRKPELSKFQASRPGSMRSHEEKHANVRHVDTGHLKEVETKIGV